jgi:GNAT superfamily N-acetyltransferase
LDEAFGDDGKKLREIQEPFMHSIAIHYRQLQLQDYAALLQLANQVHGDGYLDQQALAYYHQLSIKNGIDASFVAYAAEQLVGFRLCWAAGQWQPDQWCSTGLWQTAVADTCYFKCNTIAPHWQGHGVGAELMNRSLAALKQQGAKAGVAHLWRQSPGNAAVKYFTKQGGQLVKVHPDKWRSDSHNGYECVRCGFDCRCEAAEMIIYF